MSNSNVDLYRVRCIVDELQSTLALSIHNRVDIARHCDGFNMRVYCADVRPVDLVRDLGVLIDSNMTRVTSAM